MLPTDFSSVERLYDAHLNILFAAEEIDPDQVIKDAQEYVDENYGKESDIEMSDLKKHLESLKAALALGNLKPPKITPEQKLGLLLKLSKVSTLAYKKKGKIFGMRYGKDAYRYLQDAVELNPESLEAARALGDAVSGMVTADSQGIIQSALEIKLKVEAARALEILEKTV